MTRAPHPAGLLSKIEGVANMPGGGTPVRFIRGCSARTPDPLPFYIPNFSKKVPLLYTFALKRYPFYILFPEKVPLLYTFPRKGTPFLYLSLKRYPFYILTLNYTPFDRNY